MRRPRGIQALCAAVLAAVAGVCLAASAPAGASATQASIFQDDLLLEGSGAAMRDATLDFLRGLGVDTIRAFVPWSQVAPAADATARPSGFDPADPAAYPVGAWDPFDGLVRAASARGLAVILTPTAPIPAWASDCRGSVTLRHACTPDPGQLGAFVRALGIRYSGAAGLPRVSRWAIWNEPNVGRWLTPQWVYRDGRLVPVSPARYRRMAYAAIAALRATGHGRDLILLGETGPIGHTTGPLMRRPVATAEFWRDLLCIDAAGRPLGGRAAREQDCRRPRRLDATAIAHHPYIQGGSHPPLTPARPDEITISSPGRLKAILAAGARRGTLRAGLPIYYTEYGFQTNPPDTLLGVSLGRQAAYLDESEWIAYRDPAVRGLAQYLLRDDADLAGFQSGLEFVDGRVKPSLAAYRFVLYVVREGVSVTVFGRVRPARVRGPGVVRVQVRLPHRRFVDLLTAHPNAAGFFVLRHWSRHGSWRAIWSPGDGGAPLRSRVTGEAAR
jgi:hypothetical protein